MLSSSRHCSNCNVRRGFYSLALLLSISKVEMLYRDRTKAAAAQVQV